MADPAPEAGGPASSAQNEEQRRIDQGLHDDVAQLLAARSVKLALARIADAERREGLLEDIDEILLDTVEKIRSLSFELASSTLGGLGLVEALRELEEARFLRFGLRIGLAGEGDMEDLDSAPETVLFKAVRERLINVVKHARVDEAEVLLHRSGSALEVVVEDRRVGFSGVPQEERIGMRKGLGLFGIRERMYDLAGEMRIESKPGIETRVTFRLPLRERGSGGGPAGLRGACRTRRGGCIL